MRGKIPMLILVGGLLMAPSCEEREKKQRRMPSREALIEANKEKVSKETGLIDAFVEQSGWKMKSTDTGLRYMVYHHGQGDSATTGMSAKVAYQAYLLDGTRIGGTDVSGPVTFTIGQGEAVSGLHEAVDLLAQGDSARFILPSYLAYGLTGDQERIPPNAAIFYDLVLVDLD